MHEAVDARLIQQGDRIGHGLALGCDIDRHAAESPLVLQPAEERLDDLLWELERTRRGECDSEHARTEYVRAECERLGRVLYAPESPSIEDMIAARRLRSDPSALRELGYPKLSPAPSLSTWGGPWRLLRRHLSDEGVFVRGQHKIEVRFTPGERRALQTAQTFLQTTLSRLEVTIESNPSSNLLIGDLRSLQDHPVFRLVPLETAAPRVGIAVSANTDNPVTFGSCLGDEFAMLHHALLSLEAGAVPALRWIDAAREAGMRSRFTVPASARDEVLDEVVKP